MRVPDHDHWLRDWDDFLHQLRSSQEALLRLHQEETNVEETHAGTLLATVHALQARRAALKLEVAELKHHKKNGQRQLREAAQETRAMEE